MQTQRNTRSASTRKNVSKRSMAALEKINAERSEKAAKRTRPPKSERNTGNVWSDEDVGQLRELAAGNTPTRVIGLKLGRTETSIRSKARTESIPLSPANRSPYGRADKITDRTTDRSKKTSGSKKRSNPRSSGDTKAVSGRATAGSARVEANRSTASRSTASRSTASRSTASRSTANASGSKAAARTLH